MTKILILSIMTIFLFGATVTFKGTNALKPVIHENNHGPHRVYYNEPKKYALLIGGGANQKNGSGSYYKNIEYVANTLKKLNYKKKYIRILFNGGKTKDHPIVDGDATKRAVLDELDAIRRRIDSNDSLLIFRCGHGMIELVFSEYGILSNDEFVSDVDDVHIIGTAAVMVFPEASLSYIELGNHLAKINARQIIVILNQCFSGQFTNIATQLDNTVVVTETGELEIAFYQPSKNTSIQNGVWPFVKCFCDGFTSKGKKTVFGAFQYMLECNPNVKGIPIKADSPLLKESPQIKYGNGLIKELVFIN